LIGFIGLQEFVRDLVDKMGDGQSSRLPVLQISIQLIANLLASSNTFRDKSSSHVWHLATVILTKVEDAKSQDLAACLLLQILKQDDGCDLSICREVIVRLSERGLDTEHCDFSLLYIRQLAASSHFLQLGREERILILDMIRDLELVTSGQLPWDNLLVVVKDFTYLTDVILTKTLGTVSQ
jgi:hypothetical protein